MYTRIHKILCARRGKKNKSICHLLGAHRSTDDDDDNGEGDESLDQESPLTRLRETQRAIYL